MPKEFAITIHKRTVQFKNLKKATLFIQCEKHLHRHLSKHTTLKSTHK